MAAVIVDSGDHDDIRATLESLRLGKSPRLHWRDESPPRQLMIAERLSNMPVRGVVAVHLHEKETRSERARRLCLERLLVELDKAGVAVATIESRSPSQDHLDLLLLMGVRRTRTLSENIRIIWRPSHEEPLLWAADAVVGATTWWLDGQVVYFDLLAERVQIICLD